MKEFKDLSKQVNPKSEARVPEEVKFSAKMDIKHFAASLEQNLDCKSNQIG